jgi:hypothetical protein
MREKSYPPPPFNFYLTNKFQLSKGEVLPERRGLHLMENTHLTRGSFFFTVLYAVTWREKNRIEGKLNI